MSVLFDPRKELHERLEPVQQTHAVIRKQRWEVAVLPFGATEPHNLHMPYGADTYQVDAIGQRVCERANQNGARVILLPTIPYGVNTNFLRIPGGLTCSLNPTTLYRIITDLVDSMERQGVRKLVLLNGHGGNELKPILRELHERTTVFLCLCDWYRMAVDLYPRMFQQPSEHADEVETSLGLAYFPDLVKMEQAEPGVEQPTRFEAINRHWVKITRPWHLATASTGLGNPAAATADKGRQLMEVLVDRLGQFLTELASTPMDDRFPY